MAQVRIRPSAIELLPEHGDQPLITATRDGDRLRWQDHRSEAGRGEVGQQVVKHLNQTIKAGMPTWLDNMREYMSLAEEDW